MNVGVAGRGGGFAPPLEGVAGSNCSCSTWPLKDQHRCTRAACAPGAGVGAGHAAGAARLRRPSGSAGEFRADGELASSGSKAGIPRRPPRSVAPGRPVDRKLELSEFHANLADSYSHTGRPSIDPNLMIRMLIIGCCYGIHAEHRLCEKVRMNLPYR